MKPIASPAQLRASFLRWSLFLVPAIVLLGYLAGQFSGLSGYNFWFSQLTKPASYPEPAMLGIIWTVLYVLMGFAIAVVCTAWGSRYRLPAILAFVVQFLLNLAWAPVFFLYHEMGTALAILLALDVAVIVTTALCWMVRRKAALMMAPYLVWLLFTTVLVWQILQLNPDAGEPDMTNAVQRIEL